MFESCEEPIFEAEVGIACRPSSSSARAAPPADRRASRRDRSARRPPSGTCGFPLSEHVEDVKHRKVMVVEDDHLIREAIAEALDEKVSAERHFSKPCDLDELLDTVWEFTGGP